MGYKAKNFAFTHLAGSLAADGLTFTVNTGTGSRFPTLVEGDFTIVALESAEYRELLKVVAISSDTFTVAADGRGYESTTPRAWVAGTVVRCCLTAGLTAQALAAGIRLDDHEAAADPHPQYATSEEVAAAVAPAQNTANGALQKSGGTMTGAITLAGDASSALHAVPKQQLDAAIAAIPPPPPPPPSFLTGMGMDWWLPNAPDGWVFASGRTIGNAASGATERANADCQALFIALWDAYPNSILPVSGGRGASAAADWAANKTIALIDKRGRVSAGKDDMGGTVASRMTTAGAGIDGKVLGAAGGTQTHTLTNSQMPSHSHGIKNISVDSTTGQPPGYGMEMKGAAGYADGGYLSLIGGVATYTMAEGGSGAHNNTQPTIVCNYIIKL